jgi:general secretion pathway protein J
VSRREAGFTLLEMLVALVVFGIVMAGIAQTFRFGLAAWSAGPRHAARPEALAALDLALTPMIAQALPGSMTGRPDGLAFTTRLPAGAGLNGGLADVSVTARNGELLLRYTRHSPGIPLGPRPGVKVEPLGVGIARLRAGYLAARPGGAPGWSSSWSGGGLPLLIRIHVDLASGQTWPDLVAAPSEAGN